ncbi:hypothetical protein QS257_13605 [Terrilactibacillus sp. S3-3]|nr:hypothetical protein QS257_13605 [Terrilactibacillus sp. S3-3]
MVDSKDVENNKHIFKPNSQIEITDSLEKSFKLLKTFFPDFYYLFNTLIGTIFSFKVRGFGGGSVSRLIGVIWLNPIKNWNIVDIGEQLYHEFIHNAFFIDDMIHGTFPDPNACATEDALVISAIRKQKRPIHLCYFDGFFQFGKTQQPSRGYILRISQTLSYMRPRAELGTYRA